MFEHFCQTRRDFETRQGSYEARLFNGALRIPEDGARLRFLRTDEGGEGLTWRNAVLVQAIVFCAILAVCEQRVSISLVLLISAGAVRAGLPTRYRKPRPPARSLIAGEFGARLFAG